MAKKEKRKEAGPCRKYSFFRAYNVALIHATKSLGISNKVDRPAILFLARCFFSKVSYTKVHYREAFLKTIGRWLGFPVMNNLR